MLRKLDPETGRELAHGSTSHATVSDVAVGGGLVWAASVPDGVVYGLDESDSARRRRFAAGPDPERISFAGGRLWIANSAAGTVVSLDPRSGRAAASPVGAAPTSVAYGNGVVWTGTVPEPPPLPPVGGPELRLRLRCREPVTRSTRSTADEQLEDATCADLLAYPDAPGPAGKRCAPRSPPRCHAFRRRSHVHLPHPPRLPLLAAVQRAGDGGDVQAHARARLLAEARQRRARPERGAGDRGPAVLARQGRARLGDQGDAATRSRSRSRRPSGDFLARISLPHLCPVPLRRRSARPASARPVPSSGPYYVSSIADGRLVLLRNPGYGGHRPRRLGADRLHARRPDPGGGRARRPRHARLPPARLRRRSLLDARRCSTALRPGQRGRPRRRAALLPDRRALPRLHRAQRGPPALPRRAAAARGQLRARPASARSASSTTMPGDQIVPPSVDGFPAGAVYPLDGPDLTTRPTARRRPDGASAVLSTARSSRTATTAVARSHRS